MQIKHSDQVSAKVVEEAEGVTIRWLWSDADGAPTFALRLFEVEPGGCTPFHTHGFEHVVYILSGQAIVRGESEEHPLVMGDTTLVMPDEVHQFINPGTVPLRFLCAIPKL